MIDYTLNEELADQKDLEALDKLGINLKLDFILNHASVLSSQFQDILKNGDDSKYRDFFIDWNKFSDLFADLYLGCTDRYLHIW